MRLTHHNQESRLPKQWQQAVDKQSYLIPPDFKVPAGTDAAANASTS